MKRKALGIFSFLLILLLFCTLVSPKVEEEMRTLVDSRKTFVAGSGRNISVGGIALAWEHSDDVLYQLVEGSGWENGLRVAEIPSTYYERYESHVEFGPGTDYWYIYSASREPAAGDGVTLVEETWKGEDLYLLWSPNAITDLDKLPNYSMTLLQQSENAALVRVRQANFPYFEHRIWYNLKEELGDEMRSYSLSDVERFLKALPWITGIGMVLLDSLLLWGASWLYLGKKGVRKVFLWLNAFLTAGLLAVLPWLQSRFDLPASLLPKECILDISHYVQTFDRILHALDAMGNQNVRTALVQAGTQSAMVLGLGLLSAAVLLMLESFLCRRSRERSTGKS